MLSISAFALAAALLALAGCGSSSSSSSSASTAAQAPTTSSAAAPTTSSSAAAPTTSSTKAATPAPAAGSEKLSLEANPEGQLAYNTKSLSAKAGKVLVDFTNKSPLPHNVTIESSSGEKVGATPTFSGGAKSVSVTLKPGTYKFFCSVPGHRQAGMEGTLTVK
ncbi:MAG TPA: plastocyanin/azurin family copper-binding protein [Solirubrobacteraceae bacterium]|nr:plastocyanin/azurin family copper-binding protein [Solirubrobacteraceae bacterium]